MPSNIADVDTFTDPIVKPADGDAAAASVFAPTPEGLANRTRWLRERMRPSALAAAGTNAGNAATMDEPNVILSGSLNQGVRISTDLAGQRGEIWNASNVALILYPPSGETLVEFDPNVGTTHPWPVAPDEHPVTLDPLSLYHWVHNPGAGIDWLVRKSESFGGDVDIQGDIAVSGDADVAGAATVDGLLTATGIKAAPSGNGSDTISGYREGTTTPALATTNSNGTFTYGALRTLRYRRINGIVFFEFRINVTCTATGTGNLKITGLPYAVKDPTLSTPTLQANIGAFRASGGFGTGVDAAGMLVAISATPTEMQLLADEVVIGAAGMTGDPTVISGHGFYFTDAAF